MKATSTMPSIDSITVILPVFNGMPYLPEAVRSVLSQDFDSWHLLISDNGSTDGTRNYLRNLKDKGDRRIRIFLQDQNLGIYGNLNFLLEKSETYLNHILCSDDYFSSSSSLGEIVSSWPSSDESVGAVVFNSSRLLNDGVPTRLGPPASQVFFFVYGNLVHSLSDATLSKDAFNAMDNFDQCYPSIGDFEYWARLSTAYAIQFSNLTPVTIRSHPEQASRILQAILPYYEQRNNVASDIFNRICPPNRVSSFLLRISGTLQYDSLWRIGLLRSALVRPDSKTFATLCRVGRQSQFLLNSVLRNILCIISFRGRLGAKIIFRTTIRLSLKPNLFEAQSVEKVLRAEPVELSSEVDGSAG
ncbi:MAG: glycosyltransferase family A protein [Prochlorococcaceae cyanobacterium]